MTSCPRTWSPLSAQLSNDQVSPDALRVLHHLAQHLVVHVDLAVNVEFVILEEAVLFGVGFPDLRQEILEVKIPPANIWDNFTINILSDFSLKH